MKGAANMARDSIGWLVPALILLAWEATARTGLLSSSVMPAPSAVLAAFWRLLVRRTPRQHRGQQRARAGRLRRRRLDRLRARSRQRRSRALSRDLTDTTLQMVRNIPHLALIPLVILWFGIGEEAKLFLVALGVFFPIYVNTLLGIQSVDPQLIEMGRIYGMGRFDAVPARDPARRAAGDLRRPALRARHHVADADRRRDHLRLLGARLHGDAGARVPADRRRRAVDPDLRAARQAGRQRGAAAGALYLQWHPAFQTAKATADDQHDPISNPRPARRRAARRILSGGAGSALSLRGLSKGFGDKLVLDGIDLDVPAGQFLAIIGKSGCGKSTLLRLLAGLEQPTSGAVTHGAGAGGRADTRIMFQEPRLLPWARVADNVAVGLTGIARGAGAPRRARAPSSAEVGLADRAGEWPAVLSGGQKQRVALARALVGRAAASLRSTSRWARSTH